MEINVYTNISSTSCRKAIQWFNKEGIPFTEIKMNKTGVTKEQLKVILSLTDNGLDDVLKRTVNRRALDDLSLHAALERIVETPSMLKVPIIISGRKMQIGFQEEYIRVFIPKSHRKLQLVI